MTRQVSQDDPRDGLARFHEHARNRPPGRPYDLARLLLGPFVRLLYRPRCAGADRVRAPAIVAPNHFSYLDPFFVAICLPHKVRFMGKSELFESPLRLLLPHLGAFPVRRGEGDEETFRTANAILAQGGVVVMYPEGGRSPAGELGDPKPGVGRLALESGAPVVPAAIVGSEEIRTGWRPRFPSVSVRFGEPIEFHRATSPGREQAQAAAEAVFDRVRELYAGASQSPAGAAASR